MGATFAWPASMAHTVAHSGCLGDPQKERANTENIARDSANRAAGLCSGKAHYHIQRVGWVALRMAGHSTME
ncbi:hypothetical protein BJX62DRAFT_69937 [Aspergillus germanicus]